MCSQTRCRNCSKITWAGCGQHAQQVLAGVPTSQRCSCSSDDRSAGGGLLARLLGR
jgi:hypothetical protein